MSFPRCINTLIQYWDCSAVRLLYMATGCNPAFYLKILHKHAFASWIDTDSLFWAFSKPMEQLVKDWFAKFSIAYQELNFSRNQLKART